MKSIQEYKLEEMSFAKATVFGVLLMVVSFAYKFFFDLGVDDLQDSAQLCNLIFGNLMVHVVMIALLIVSVVWTYRIAIQKDRNAVMWAILALLFPAIAIIVVANLSIKYESDEIGKTVYAVRNEYYTKLGVIYNNHSISDTEQTSAVEKVKKEYELLLKRRLAGLRADSLIDHLETLKNQGELDVEFDAQVQRQVLIDNITCNLLGTDKNVGRCPACNSIVSEDAIICSECEIILK